MQTSTKAKTNVLVTDIIDGEIASCYDECEKCRHPDCFLLDWFPGSSYSGTISVNAFYDQSVYD